MAKFHIGQPVRFVRQDPSQAGWHYFEDGELIELQFVPDPSVIGDEYTVADIYRSDRCTFYWCISDTKPAGFAAETELEPLVRNPDAVEKEQAYADH